MASPPPSESEFGLGSWVLVKQPEAAMPDESTSNITAGNNNTGEAPIVINNTGPGELHLEEDDSSCFSPSPGSKKVCQKQRPRGLYLADGCGPLIWRLRLGRTFFLGVGLAIGFIFVGIKASSTHKGHPQRESSPTRA